MTFTQKSNKSFCLFWSVCSPSGGYLFIQANLGTDPFNVLVQGIFRSIPWPDALHWTHGRTHMMICFLIILVLLVIDRSYIRIGTIICMFLGDRSLIFSL